MQTHNSIAEFTNEMWLVLHMIIKQTNVTLKFTISDFHSRVIKINIKGNSHLKDYLLKHKPLRRKRKRHFTNCNWNRGKIKTKLDQCSTSFLPKLFIGDIWKTSLLKILLMNSMLCLPTFSYGYTTN